jgi:alcohol dehydrogenase (cytochrome c)
VRRSRAAGVSVAAALLLTLGAVPAGSAGPSDAGAPPEVRAAGAAAWPLPDHDAFNSRTAGPSPVTAATVSRLAPAWRVTMAGGLTTSPLILGGRLYAEDDLGTVVCAQASTGRVLWRSAPTGVTVGPDGVAVGWGDVFAATPRGVVALRASDGRPVWRRRLTATATEGVDIQPVLAGRRLLVATVPVSLHGIYHGGDRGWLYALDARTGRTDWGFDTVASPRLWGHPAINSGGGAWYPPAVDLARGRVYWGTANPAPFPGIPGWPNGSSRPGPNHWTDSTVALSLRTGRLLWARQDTAHDIFDRDFVHALVVPVTRPRPGLVVVGTGKSGDVLGMDPTTGRLRWRTEVGLHHNDQLRALPGPTVVLPGTFGGVLTPPAAAGGTVYVATLNAPDTLTPTMTAYFGGQTGTHPGQVVALDAASGRVRWRTAVPGDPTGGATVVNDLVLTATLQGDLVALDRGTGRIIWTRPLGGAVNGWLSVAGGLVVVPVGGTSPPELLALRLGPRT